MDHIDRSIEEIQKKIAEHEGAIVTLKTAANTLCELDGRGRCYSEVSTPSVSGGGQIRSDQFYGRALATVVTEVLELRKARDLGPASVNEIYGMLIEGGFKFETKDEENAKRALRISLSKNTATFHKLPNGDYGLFKWYPNAKQPKAADAEKAKEESKGDGDNVEDATDEKKAARAKADGLLQSSLAAGSEPGVKVGGRQ